MLARTGDGWAFVPQPPVHSACFSLPTSYIPPATYRLLCITFLASCQEQKRWIHKSGSDELGRALLQPLHNLGGAVAVRGAEQ